jgi:hypothetical protein
MTYANRVKETSTTTSGTTITLSGAASGMRTFALAYAVGKARIPVYFGTTAAWMLCMCTLTDAVTLHVDKILITSLGSTTPPTFSAGTKDVFATEPAEYLNPQYVDLREFDVDPTFTNDSTAGVQAAMLEAYNGGGPIRVPVGHFAIAGPRVGSGNCQLYLPQTRESNPNKSIYFEGAHAPNFQQQGLRNVVPPNNGSLFESTLIGAGVSGTNPAMIGGEQGNSGDAWRWNYTNFGMRNMGLRTAVNASGAANPMSAINMQFVSQISVLDMLRIDVNRGLQDMASPTAGSCGIILPPIDNHLMLNIGTVYISGYNNALIAQEHTSIDNFITIGNVNGLVLKASNHSSSVRHFSAEWNMNAIVIDGNHDLAIVMYDAEHNSGTNFTFAKDILYNAGSRKVSMLHSVVVQQGVGVNDAAFVTNATSANYKILVGSGAN